MYGLIANILALLSDLLGRVTPSRANKLDQLDAAISSRAPADRAVSNAVLTDARIAKLDNLDNIATVPDRIKNRWHFQVVVTSGSGYVEIYYSLTANIGRAVDRSKCRLILNGVFAQSAGTCSGGAYILPGGDVIYCRGNTASSGMTWCLVLEEFY